MIRIEFNPAEVHIEAASTADGKRIVVTLSDVDDANNKLFLVVDADDARTLRRVLGEAVKAQHETRLKARNTRAVTSSTSDE